MLQTPRRTLQRLKQVAQHPVVYGDLLGIAPTGYQIWPLVERGIDDVRYLP